MKKYWVSFIQESCAGLDLAPWLCTAYEPCTSLDEAKKEILEHRKHYDVLSAWVDVYNDRNEKQTVFHECYVDVAGYIQKPKEPRYFAVKYEDFELSDSYEESNKYDTENEANDAIDSEVYVIKEHLDEMEIQYDIEDFGNIVEITETGSTTVLFRWARMWREK